MFNCLLLFKNEEFRETSSLVALGAIAVVRNQFE